MKKKSENAKFFCENCGAEVPQNARMCRKCGRFFSSVRCPKCGATGDASIFKKGCPTCGYAVTGSGYKDGSSSLLFSFTKNWGRKKSFSKSDKGFYDGGLPLWIYVFTISTFLLVAFILFRTLLK